MTDPEVNFKNSWGNQTRAESYSKLEFPNTYYLAYRDLPEIISRHVTGNKAVDFGGVYTKVLKNKAIEYIMEDGRKVEINFADHGTETKVVETFEMESENSYELQKGGWQAILDNFKRYSESGSKNLA